MNLATAQANHNSNESSIPPSPGPSQDQDHRQPREAPFTTATATSNAREAVAPYVRRYRRSSASSSSNSSSSTSRRAGRKSTSRQPANQQPHPTFTRIQNHYCMASAPVTNDLHLPPTVTRPFEGLIPLLDLLVHESLCDIFHATMHPLAHSAPHWATAMSKYTQAHRLYTHINRSCQVNLPVFASTRWHLLTFTAIYFFRWLLPANTTPSAPSGYCFRHRHRGCTACATLTSNPTITHQLPALLECLPSLDLGELVRVYLDLHTVFFEIQSPRVILNESWTRLALYLMDFAVVEHIVCRGVDQHRAIEMEFVPFDERFDGYDEVVKRLTKEAKRIYVDAVEEQQMAGVAGDDATTTMANGKGKQKKKKKLRSGGAGSLRVASVQVLMDCYRVETLDKNMETYIASIAKKLPEPDLLRAGGDVGKVLGAIAVGANGDGSSLAP